ncbi:LysR substrate-binding domain-containing protein [Enemella sp. A6]|uniref:LysR substrate-binding domain-containing protein n=1 Tax=Enemella sp. A6 TaxID=3440152 RepID=UPI003EC00D43
MNLRDLEYLVALDEHRHFGRAAAASYASQPTLSTQIRKLETELGVDLIERGSRQVLFTPVGDLVVDKAKQILAEVAEIRRIARFASEPYAGTLRLGAFPTLAPYLLPHITPQLHRAFPELEILLVEEKTDTLVSQLRTGRLDAALIALPVNDEALHAEPLFRENFVLATPAEHPLADSPSALSSTKLAAEDLLLLTEGHCLRDQALDVCANTGAVARPDFQATSLETLRLMVASGVGITLLPELSVSPPVPQNPSLSLRRFAEPAPSRDIAMVWRKTSVQAELLREVAEVFREAVDDTPLLQLTG